ncbi:MAG: PAS domain-containing protein, partial [Deltaproteobacteria bacterium]|nr:PAS domain-containing protein [Deltaproteobacteria bacterium]
MTKNLTREAMHRRIAELEARLAQCRPQAPANHSRESAERLQRIVEMGDDGIVVFTEDSRIEFANQMASKILGVSRETIIGSEFYPLIGKSNQEFLTDMVGRESGVGQKFCTEMTIKTPRGDLVHAEVCIAPARTDDGRSITYAYIRDITERKRYEQARKESEEKYRSLFERVRHGIYISARQGRFVDCNPALLEMLGYESKAEFLNMDIARDIYQRPEERLSFQRLIEKQGFVKDLEVEFKKKNGEAITVLLTAHVKRDARGRIFGYEGIINDISERKRMEKELREANEFLTRLIESSVDGIIVADMQGNVLIFNKGAENMLGYRAEEVVGKMNIRGIYPPGVAKEVMSKLRSEDFGGVGKLASLPLPMRRKDGEVIEGDLSASLVYDQEGNELVSVGIFKE